MTTRIQISVGFKGGQMEHRMVTIEADLDGLAFHKAPDLPQFWTVTHIVSGLSIVGGMELRADAASAMKELAASTDWERDAEEIRDDDNIEQIREDIVAAAAKYHGLVPGWAEGPTST